MARMLLVAMFLAAAVAHAQVPQAFTFRGHLAQQAGGAAGPLALTFRLYTTASGGIPIWTESHPSVTVSNGVFESRLGSVTPFGLAFDQPYYLGISVGAEGEMSPRTRLLAAPYALRSATTDTLEAGAVVSGSIIDATVPLDRLGSECATGRLLVRVESGWQCLPGP